MRREIPLVGAVAICTIAILIKYLVKIPAKNEPAVTGVNEVIPGTGVTHYIS